MPAAVHQTPVSSTASGRSLRLRFGLAFEELYRREGLLRLDGHFLACLADTDGDLHGRLLLARSDPDATSPEQYSSLIVDLAPQIDAFVADLFGVRDEIAALSLRHRELAAIYSVKRQFVQRRAVKQITAEQAALFDAESLERDLAGLIGEISEINFAQHVEAWLKDPEHHKTGLDIAMRYSAWATLTEGGRRKHCHGVLFQIPNKVDPFNLVPVERHLTKSHAALQLPVHERRERDGFGLTDSGADLVGALDQANYCIWCHHQDKDSCSKGLRERPGAFRKNSLGVTLTGCPLEEKISEMNAVKAAGYAVGALAIVTVDNPLCAATGHRICNDCMKSCIFQKQDAVDVPQIETRVLKDVLELPWGFEIYSLLTRWNPLNIDRPVPKPLTGRTVLVVGLGPAGFTLAHHLVNDGHVVVGIDGLKIEPLPADVSGVDYHGERHSFRPVHWVDELRDGLDARVMAGFGGVAEYGITVRWDKNYLKLVRLLLERRSTFKMFGGVRFGGTLTPDSAFELGFDHIALCAGAGRPTLVKMKNGLAPGVRQASDFLMALQLTGAARRDSTANLQVRLPVVVIGGGLTAVDTATEALAYYPMQVEKYLVRYETLAAERGSPAVFMGDGPHDREVSEEFIAHARALRAERHSAKRDGRSPRILDLLLSWGGATIVYRRRLIEAPSYVLNHEEVVKAMQEGIRWMEELVPTEVVLDEFGHANALRCRTADRTDGDVAGSSDILIPARTILVAAGTQPNTMLAREFPDHVQLDGRYFQAFNEAGLPVRPEQSAKPAEAHVLIATRPDGRAISFFGDLHPSFAGNVVKAMASAKRGYPTVSRILERRPAAARPENLMVLLDRELRPTVHEVVRLTPTIVELIVRAPRAAREFRPGQFFRVQNYETLAATVDGTKLAMEGLALTGAGVDRERGLISLIALEMGGSSNLCATLQPGDPLVIMGPTGAATEIPAGETLLLIGGGLGNAVLMTVGQAARTKGNRVLYVAGYKRAIDRYKAEELERAADVVLWCCDEAPGFEAARPQDRCFVGNVVAGLSAYGRNELGPAEIPLTEVDRIVAIGSAGMMSAVAATRKTILAPLIKPDHLAIGSINSPMQCMMKEICAQCLQRHIEPTTGVETVVFSCANQDQNLDSVDFESLQARLSQNSTQEKMTRAWIERCLRERARLDAN